MLLPEAGLNQAESVAEDCRQTVLSLPEVPVPLTVSLGVATLMPCDADQEDYGSTDTALQAVETALAAALAYPHAQSADAMAHQLEALRGFRPTVRPADLRCPTQVLHGAEDLLIPRAAAEDAFAQIPNVTQTTLPNAGHSIHWDASEAVAQHLRQFHATAGDPR